jgi:hypothetical protein
MAALSESIRKITTFLLAVFIWLHALFILSVQSTLAARCAQYLRLTISETILLALLVIFSFASGSGFWKPFRSLPYIYATHKHPRVKRWFAARPRFHVHFTPTYASWLSQVQIWFNRIMQQAIRRGTFRSVKELVEKIDQYVRASNSHAQPFVWTATADSIFAKVQRLCERISGTAH